MSISRISLPIVAASLSCFIFSTGASAGFQDMFKSAGSVFGDAKPLLGATSAASLSDSQIGDGLKEALSIGAERAVSLLGSSGGFLNDQSVRIPLPGMLQTAGKALRAVGQGSYVDNFENTVNRAAEQAIPETISIVKDTVRNMSLEDVRGILSGNDDAATQFLRKRAGSSLHQKILPIVSQATDKAGATSAYKSLKAKSDGALGGSSLGGLGGFLKQDKSLDLDDYVTEKALDGLFLKLAAEEKAIRENPIARSTDLLKKVFTN